MKIIIYSTHQFEKPYLKKAADSSQLNCQLTFILESLNEHTVELARGSDAVSIFTSDIANAQVLKSLHKIGVKYLALRSVGHDHVDLAMCKQLGIKVANVPEYSPFSIAEHAMTLILCLNRKIKLSGEQIKRHDFRLDKLVGFDMNKKTIGIIGTGRIGAAFAKIANGFGCKLLAYDVRENDELKREVNINYVSLEELWRSSDIISLHCPLNESTNHLLNKDKFQLMKEGVFIVNTSRGAVINSFDLLEALESGKVGAAGLDVYEYEKNLFFTDHSEKGISDNLFLSLQARENVLITAHQAFLTDEALTNIASTTIYNLNCWEKGESSPSEI